MKTNMALAISETALRTMLREVAMTAETRRTLAAAGGVLRKLREKAQRAGMTWTHYEGGITATVKGGQWCCARLPQQRDHCLLMFCDVTGAMVWQHGEALPWKKAAALATRLHRALERDHAALLSMAQAWGELIR